MPQYRDVPGMVDAVIKYVCPMCRSGQPVDEDGWHSKDQHCYARMLRKIIEEYECPEQIREELEG